MARALFHPGCQNALQAVQCIKINQQSNAISSVLGWVAVERWSLQDGSKGRASTSSPDCRRRGSGGRGVAVVAGSNQSSVEDVGAGTSPTRKGRKRMSRKKLLNLITLERSDSKWAEAWETQQATTLEELGLTEMAIAPPARGLDKPRMDVVVVDLAVSKVSVRQVADSSSRAEFTAQFSDVVTDASVDTPFQVWLSPTKDEGEHSQQAGGDNVDSTVVYFPVGDETADLTQIVRDTIRLSQFSKAICSENCRLVGARKWEIGVEETTVDTRWSPLLAALRNPEK